MSAFAYEQVAADMEAQIERGTLRPGDRIPSLRKLSAQRRLSIPTVLQAYRLLEARRVIEARPRSGYYVLSRSRAPAQDKAVSARLADAAEITTGDLIMRSLEMVANPDLIPLGTALPEPRLLPAAALARALGRAAREDVRQGARYATAAGAPELRQEIACRAMAAGANVAAEDVVVTCGCAEAIVLCLRALTQPGDTVAVESPAYFGTLQALGTLGLKALEIPVDARDGISLELLEAALRRGAVAAVVVTPTVHNPLGSVMPEERKRALAAMLARYGVPAVEDDTYGELHWGSERPPTLQAFDEAGLVLSCGSFSKTLAPGYRVGWALPGRFRERVLHYKLSTTVATSIPPQLALAHYLAAGGFDPHLRRLRRTFRSNVDRFISEIHDRLPAGTRVHRPTGGFLLWVQLAEGVEAVELQRRALAHGLSIAAGPAFSASGGFASCIRVNAGYCWSATTGGALDKLARLLHEMTA